jgi:hypothetical protein
MANDVTLDERAVYELLHDPAGLVGVFIDELSTQAALVATAVVHVRPGTPASATTGRTSNAFPRGYTKARIRVHTARPGSRTGNLYGGVNAPYAPATWLETPAIQMARLGHEFPFLTTGLWSLEGTF